MFFKKILAIKYHSIEQSFSFKNLFFKLRFDDF